MSEHSLQLSNAIFNILFHEFVTLGRYYYYLFKNVIKNMLLHLKNILNISVIVTEFDFLIETSCSLTSSCLCRKKNVSFIFSVQILVHMYRTARNAEKERT